MNSVGKRVAILLATVACIISICANRGVLANEQTNVYGLQLSTYVNDGKEYNDWWGESEVVAYIEGLPNRLTRGAYGVSVLVQDYTLLDGYYGVEISLCKERSPYSFFTYIGTDFKIRNGRFVPNESSGNVAFRKVDGGYLVDLAGGYAQSDIIDNYVICIKLHSNVTEQNGTILFSDFFFADRLSGVELINLEDSDLVLSAERLQTREKVPVSIKQFPTIKVANKVNTIYVGNSVKLSVTDNVGGELTFKSSNKDVATVSKSGKITAKAVGSTTISVINKTGEVCEWRLNVEEPGLYPVMVKNKVLLDTNYTFKVEARGYDGGSVTWASSKPSIGVIDKNTGIFHALKPGKTTLTAKDSKGNVYKIKVEVYEDTTGVASYIVMHDNPDAGEKLQELIYEHLLKVYKNVYETFGDGTYNYIDVYFEDIDFAAAYACYGDGDNRREIHIGIDTMMDNINDVDCATHELIHTAQSYGFCTETGDDRTWLGEGLTDYGRYLLGVQNDKAGWSLGKYQPGQQYTDSYRTTASFIKYVVDVHDSAFAQELNQAFRDGTYNEYLWLNLTGYSIDELWEMYKMW